MLELLLLAIALIPVLTVGISNVGALRYLILRKELVWGEHDGAGSDVLVPFWDDGFSVRPRNVFTSQLHVTGVRGDTHRALTARDFAGAMNFGVWPELAKDLLDFATVIDANGDLSSYTMTIVDPSIETMRYYGVRVNTLSMRLSEGEPTLLTNFDLIAKYGEELDAGIPALPSYPADQSFVLQDGTLLLSVGAGLVDQATLQSFEITVENGLKPGKHGRDDVVAKNKTISTLRTGTQRVRGTVELEHEGELLTEAVLAGSTGSLELLLGHPGGSVVAVAAAGAVAGAAVAIPVKADPTSLFDPTIEEHVFCETNTALGAGDPDKRSVAKVTAVTTVPDEVTVAVLDRDLVEDDKLYGHALRVKVGGLDLASADPSGGREDNRNQTLEFEANDDGTGIQFSYDVEIAP